MRQASASRMPSTFRYQTFGLSKAQPHLAESGAGAQGGGREPGDPGDTSASALTPREAS